MIDTSQGLPDGLRGEPYTPFHTLSHQTSGPLQNIVQLHPFITLMAADHKISVIWWGESLEGECGPHYKKKLIAVCPAKEYQMCIDHCAL